MWVGARLVTQFADLANAGAALEIGPFTLHRQVIQQGERGLLRSH